jgi:hypothetical protein
VITEADFLAAVGEAPYDYIGVEVSAGAKHSGCTYRIYRTRLDS